MSKFRLEIDVCFVNEADATALKNFINTNRAKAHLPTGLEAGPLYRTCKKSLESYDGIAPTAVTTVNFDAV